ncbi:DNA-directed RNA polymerase III subunit RPC4-like isoform X2 [Phymastichus coffea]|uniref:DNA-directed RNA polymerase III subunit RPC4-like isoform X2 n=1 Tax=Phymastichus coffea TaxID=108790 RepID=UPI00273BFAD8|nr:DNA-directed RNA polymerase III subunit RPC4-like isoform X2 [Phymastichus coffea]
MASNNLNTHPDYDPNIKIKSEPNIESATPAINPVISNLITNIKTESGLSTSSSTLRLPSFRPPRDYTLGGTNVFTTIKSEKPRKVFTPNLNVQRNKNREDVNASKKNESGKSEKGLDRDKRKNDKSKGKGKGRGKVTSNLVQSSGIFFEGLADIPSRKHIGSGIYRDRDGSGSSRETGAILERPKLSIPEKINKLEEEEKLRDLRRDDFINNDVDIDMENTPISLPMIHESNLFKTDSSQKLDFTKEIPVYLQNGNASHAKMKPSISDTKIKKTKLPLTVSQVMENKSNNFILIQLPDCLPGLQSEDDPRSKRVAEPGPENEANISNQFCTLNSLKEGMLGKLQILRSGKARLMLGNNNLIVDVGSNISFRQDLIVADVSDDKQSGDLVHLGAVSSTLICSPDWENMLKAL